MKKQSIMVVIFLLTAVLSGCADTKSAKQELSMEISSSPATVDPQMGVDFNSGLALSFSTACLYKYDIDGNLKPCLAKSYDLSDDGCTYTFHLKDGLKWSDGRPLTAEDFVCGFQRVADPDVGSNAVYLITDNCIIKNAREVNAGKLPVNELGVSSPDNKTFIVELEEPCPFFCSLISRKTFAPCNEDFIHSVGKRYASSADTMLYSGPYIMDRYEPLAMQIHFTANPNYVNADSISIPGVTLQVADNTQQAMMCYEAKDVDMIPISGEMLELAEGDPQLKVFPRAATFFIAENQKKCVELQNKNIRLALSKSIDRDKLVKNVLRTGSTPMTRINPPDFYRDTDGTDFSKNPNEYESFCNYDPKEARRLWEQGLKELQVKGVKLNIIYASERGSIVEAIAAQMEDALPGLKLELVALPFKELLQRQGKEEYDLLLTGWIADYSDPTSFLGLFVGTSTNGYSNPEFDRMFSKIQSARYALHPRKRNVLMHKAEDFLMEDAAVIPIFSDGNKYLIHKGVEGFGFTPTGDSCVVTSLTKNKEGQ